jgi:hypothetical protein
MPHTEVFSFSRWEVKGAKLFTINTVFSSHFPAEERKRIIKSLIIRV